MSIIISKSGLQALKLERKSFESESSLQEYIYQHPECLPIYEIKEGKRLLILCREFSTSSGPIDAIGVDDDGEIYIIETKLYKNADKRKVIAQILDYGAALLYHFTDFAAFLDEVERQSQKAFNASCSERINTILGIRDPDVLLATTRANFESGKFSFIVLMDLLEDRLKDLIRYLNQHSNFDIYGVEVDYYKFEEYQIFIPRLYGAEVQKEVAGIRQSKASRKWDESSFFEDLALQSDKAGVEKVNRIYALARAGADDIGWGTGGKSASFKALYYNVSRLPILFVDSKLWVWLYFGYIENESMRDRIIALAKANGIEVKKNNFGIKIHDIDEEKLIQFLRAVQVINNSANETEN